jgi:hypothetical protein
MVHLICLFGLRCDRDILLHFLRHYEKYPFSSRHIVFDGLDEGDEAPQIAQYHGFTPHRISGEFRDGTLRHMALSPFYSQLQGHIMAVDSDEFIDLPPEIFSPALITIDAVKGYLVDRFGPHACNAQEGIELDHLYPYAGDFYRAIAGCEANGGAGGKRKIILSRVGLPVNLLGSHMLSCEIGYPHFHNPNLAYFSKVLPVMHYSFRESIIERMSGKSYFNGAHIASVAKYYGIPLDDPRIDKVREKFRKRQLEMGWVPA